MTLKFRTTVFLGGTTATGLVVPDEIVEGLGAGRKPPVTVTIGGYSYRSTIAVYSGQAMLPLSAENRKGAGVSAGDEIEVSIALDTAPREVEIPADFASELDKHADAKARFEKLSYSNKRRIVLSIEDAKTAETRLKRIVKALDELGDRGR